jgi:N-acetylglucosamine-6-sulfatase
VLSRYRTRRSVIALAGACLIVSCLLAACGGRSVRLAGPAPGARPNFVFVLTDDLSWNLVRHMPHVQALARAGATMSRYYVVDSLCCPSRSAIFTGEYPHDDGVFTNKGSDGGYGAYNRNKDPLKSFAVAFHRAGYRTALMGKYLNGYSPADSVPPGWDEWDVAGNGYPEFGYTLNEDGKQQHYGHKASDYLTDVLDAKAEAFIGSSALAHKPFMLEVATFAPHAPYTPAPRYAHAASHLAYPRTSAYNRLPANPPSWLTGMPALAPRPAARYCRCLPQAGRG